MAFLPAVLPGAPNPGYGVQFAQGAANQINSIPQPQPAPAPTDTGQSGGGGGGTATDPFAAYGGATAYNNLTQGFTDQKNNIYGGANDAASNAGINLNSSILDLVSSLRNGQLSIDNKAVNNELAKRQGTADTYGMVGRGIRSGGVLLANKNATDSSAAGALAQAYGDMGRRQLSTVGNQYEAGNRDITQAQTSLDEQRLTGVRKIQESKAQTVNTIMNDARNQLAALNVAMAYAKVPDRIAIEQEKENIKSQVLSQLQQYDQQLTNSTSSIAPTSADARRTQAIAQQTAGQAPASAFSYTASAPAQFQDSGPFASQLPIFTLPKRQTA